MSPHAASSRRYVRGPDGSPLSVTDLPPPNTKRWVARRKAEVICAIRGGLLTIDEACARYGLTLDEIMTWQDRIARHGLRGLRATRIQQYRAQNYSSAQQAYTDNVDRLAQESRLLPPGEGT
jgi:hypothetical protein